MYTEQMRENTVQLISKTMLSKQYGRTNTQFSLDLCYRCLNDLGFQYSSVINCLYVYYYWIWWKYQNLCEYLIITIYFCLYILSLSTKKTLAFWKVLFTVESPDCRLFRLSTWGLAGVVFNCLCPILLVVLVKYTCSVDAHKQ